MHPTIRGEIRVGRLWSVGSMVAGMGPGIGSGLVRHVRLEDSDAS